MKAQVQFILTANDLFEGDVIYIAKSGGWVRSLNEALVFLVKEKAEEALKIAESNGEIVGPYIAEVEVDETGALATHFREEFRAKGPSNYFHGKQEQTNV